MIMSRYCNIGVYFAIWAFTWYLVSVLKTYSKKQKTKNKKQNTNFFFFWGQANMSAYQLDLIKKLKRKSRARIFRNIYLLKRISVVARVRARAHTHIHIIIVFEKLLTYQLFSLYMVDFDLNIIFDRYVIEFQFIVFTPQ